MSPAPIDAYPQSNAPSRLIADGTGSKIAEYVRFLRQECLSIIEGYIAAVLGRSALKNFLSDYDARKEQNDVLGTTEILVVKSASWGRGSVSYGDVLAKLQSLPNLTALSIAYDECFDRAATATVNLNERSPQDFPHLRLKTYELSCVFRGCELPMLASKNTLRWLTITPGTLHPMTAAEMERFRNGFKEVLPNLNALTLQFNRLKLRSTRERPMHRFSTLAAIDLLEEMQSQLSLRELDICDDDDQTSLHHDGLVLCHRLFAACLRPGLQKLSFSARLDHRGTSGKENAGKEEAERAKEGKGESEKDESKKETFLDPRLWQRADAEALLDCLRQHHKVNGARLRSVEIIFWMRTQSTLHATHGFQLQDEVWRTAMQEKLRNWREEYRVYGGLDVVAKHL